jgi:hypothetical protein
VQVLQPDWQWRLQRATAANFHGRNLALHADAEVLTSVMNKLLTLLLGLVSAVSLSARTLTSADGSKTIEAEIIDYNPTTGKVVICNEGSIRNTIVDATAFSADDQEYFREFLKEAGKRKSLKISADKNSEKVEKAKDSLYIYDKRNEFFTVKVSNGSPAEIEDLVAKFDIYVSKYDKEGKKIVDVVSGEEAISSIVANYTHEFTSPSVQVTVGCATTSSCPKCKTQAASVKSERVIGIHVRLLDRKSGDFLTEFFSSSAVKTAVGKKGRESTLSKADR